MKINVQIDLSEFYSEEYELSFSEQIKQAIVYETKEQVLEHFKSSMASEFNKLIISIIEEEKESLITNTMNELVNSALVKKRYGNSEMITIRQWLIEEMERMQLNENKLRDYLDKQVKTSSDTISNELKKRYDLAFASQIISKMNENSMLNPSVANMLLGNEQSNQKEN